RGGYFASDSDRDTFADELKYLMIHQHASFNSPVWFNIGVEGVPQQGSACFILSVEDDMHSILDWFGNEGIIFKGGSGSGVNVSKIRSQKEQLSGGGYASGPVSFMRGADSVAGSIKAGGTTRRACQVNGWREGHPGRVGGGGLGVRRPRDAIRFSLQRVAHPTEHRPELRDEPVLGVRQPRQHGMQSGEPEPHAFRECRGRLRH